MAVLALEVLLESKSDAGPCPRATSQCWRPGNVSAIPDVGSPASSTQETFLVLRALDGQGKAEGNWNSRVRTPNSVGSD